MKNTEQAVVALEALLASEDHQFDSETGEAIQEVIEILGSVKRRHLHRKYRCFAFVGTDLEGDSSLYVKTLNDDGAHVGFLTEAVLQNMADRINTQEGTN